MKRSSLIGCLKRTFMCHRNYAFSKKQLVKKFSCSKPELEIVLHELLNQGFLLKFRYGKQVVYVLNPIRKW
jgi:hypothetical protein